MNKIPDKLKGIIEHNSNYNYYYRVEHQKMLQKNKYEELCSIITTMTNEEIIPENWVLYHRETKQREVCICSQFGCKDIWYYEHKPSGMIFKLGRICIQHFHPDSQKQQIIEEMKEFEKDDCKYCLKKIPNKRSNISKEGFCDKLCAELFLQKQIPFCNCGIKSKKKVSKSEKNYQREFYTCGGVSKKIGSVWKNDCKFFKWVDEIEE